MYRHTQRLAYVVFKNGWVGVFRGQLGIIKNHFGANLGSPRIILGARSGQQESLWGQLGIIKVKMILVKLVPGCTKKELLVIPSCTQNDSCLGSGCHKNDFW